MPPLLPMQEALDRARDSLITRLPLAGLGDGQTAALLRDDVCPALNLSSKSPHYYGFVTGGATPIARLADNMVTEFDQNCAVHLPLDAVTVDVEDAALRLLCQLLALKEEDWPHRIFTTGATASNILGLACGRQWVLREAAKRNGVLATDAHRLMDVGKIGMAKAMRHADVDEIRILTTVPHSSLLKAASVLGLGRDSIRLVPHPNEPHRFSLEDLASELQTSRTASVIAISCSEVNTGLFATTGEEMRAIRSLAEQHGAWIHVDGAFGIMARCLEPTDAYAAVREGCNGMELADSITGDCHKLLNVPYDCGFFLSKHLDTAFAVFQNANASYLDAGERTEPQLPSPLNHGLENSRRFRALPVYANLLAYGRAGFQDMLGRQIALARRLAVFLDAHEAYERLPRGMPPETTLIIVLFRARDDALNNDLVARINASSRIYVSGTAWAGKPACRFAVSNWQVDVQRDLAIVAEVLDGVCHFSRASSS